MIAWFTEHTLVALLIPGTIFTFVWPMILRNRIGIKWYAALPFAVMHSAYCVLTAVAFAKFESAVFGMPSQLRLYGCIFLVPLLFLLEAKIIKCDVAEFFDIYTPCTIFTFMIARINCILEGCCYGMKIPGTDFRWPTRETEMIFYLFLLIILCRKILKGHQGGRIYPLYMLAYGLFRLIQEFFRVPEVGKSILHPAHLWSAICIIFGFSLLLELRNKSKKLSQRRK